MTRQEVDEVLSYVAQKIISPLCNDKTPAMDVWRRLSGEDFNKFVNFMYNDMIDQTCKEEKPVPFFMIKQGEKFRHAGIYFMRTSTTRDGYNAVNLGSGKLISIKKGETRVMPVSGKLYIE